MRGNNKIQPELIYLDQNVFSALRKNGHQREELLSWLKAYQDDGAAIVFSAVHVDEIRSSNQPESFIEVLETLPAHFLGDNGDLSGLAEPRINRARELITCPEDIISRCQKLLERLLLPVHISTGWLQDDELSELIDEAVSEITDFWEAVSKEFSADFLSLGDNKSQMAGMFESAKLGMIEQLQSIPFSALKDEYQDAAKRLRASLPENLAQLDEIPSEEVVAYVISRMDASQRLELTKQFPKDFHVDNHPDTSISLVSLSFNLFLWGVIRVRDVRRGDCEKRTKHFLGQFRDCLHISNAAHCKFFITNDARAARLAEAVYSYAGVPTQVRKIAFSEKR